MKKILIFAVCLSLALTYGSFGVLAQEDAVTAINGSVTINWNSGAAEGTYVTIFILPEIKVDGEDKTLDKVREANTIDEIDALNLAYAVTLPAEEDGEVSHSCKMGSALSTGKVYVIYNYLGLEPAWQVLDTFDHIDENDIITLVKAFNDSETPDGYESVINGDITGKNVLKASSADIDYYSAKIFDSEKTSEKERAFCQLLFGFKPGEGFDITSLIEKFNESIAWMKLRTENDTEGVLGQYNGKHWNVDIAVNSDFSTLPNDEKNAIFSRIKDAEYSSKENLENGFNTNVVLAFFRQIETTDDLKNLIDVNNAKYSSYFEEARTVVSDADLDEIQEERLYTNVLLNSANAACKTFEDIKTLFENSIPTTSSGGGSGGGGSSKNPIASTTNKYSGDFGTSSTNKGNDDGNTAVSAFKDVTDNHWAKSFVARLYNEGAIHGVSAESFAPENPITRRDFVKILVNALKIDVSDTLSAFSDVADDAYYSKYVMAAFEKGLIKGVGENLFGVNKNMKREDVALIVERLLTMYEKTLNYKGASYNDSASISEYAKEAVKVASAAGIFSGDNFGNFNPNAYLTRAETCAVICRLADFIKEV